MKADKKNIILVGGFIEIIELLLSNDIHIAGIVDESINNISVHFRERFDYIGNDEKLILSIKEKKISQLPMLLSPDLPDVRENLFAFYKRINSKHINVISTKANVSLSSKIKEESSTIIQDFVNVSSNVTISKCVHIN